MSRLAPADHPVDPDLAAISQSSLAGRLTSSVDKKDCTIESRFELWSIALKIWARYPFLGSGPETYQLFHPRFRGPSETLKYSSGATAEHAHNVVLHYLATRGIIGTAPFLLLWLATLIHAISRLWRMPKRNDAWRDYGTCLAMWMAGLSFSLTNVHTVAANTLLWALTGWLWNPSTPVGPESTLSARHFSGPGIIGWNGSPARRCAAAFALSLVASAYLLRPIPADALLLRAATTDDSQTSKKTRDYQKACEMFPRMSSYREHLINYLTSSAAQERDAEHCLALASRLCEEELASSPSNSRFIYLRARTNFLWAQKGEPELLKQAEKDARTVLAVIPYHLDTSLLLVQILLERGKQQDAMAIVDSSLQWTEGLDYVKRRLGEQVLKSGDERDCDIIVYLARLRGNLWLERGEAQLAEQQFKDILEADPDDPSTRYNLGVLCAKEERYAEAERQFSKVVAVVPDYADAKWNLDIVRSRMNKEGQRP
jgi:tetratricopeptide (TPR) repeat protein